jgi:hypothetical protein
MPFLSTSEPGLPAAWMDMLEQIQRALADALTATTQREQALEGTAAPGNGERESECLRLLQQLDAIKSPGESLENMDSIKTTEDALADAQAALDAWLTRAEQAAQRLAEQAGRAV